MKPLLVLFFYLAYATSYLAGQDADPLKQAATALKNGDCETAERLARSYDGNQETGQTARALLALVLATPTCPQHNPNEAHTLLMGVHEWYNPLDAKAKTRAREKGYNHKYFRDAKTLLIQTAVAKAVAAADTAQVNALLLAYAPLLTRKEKTALQQDKNRILVQKLHALNDPAQWQAFMATRKTDLANNHPTLLDTVYRYQVDALLAKGGWEQLHEGAALFPDNPYLNKNVLPAFLEARKNSNYQDFYNRQSTNPWRAVAKDSLAAVAQRNAELLERLQGALATIQDSAAAPEAAKAADATIAAALKAAQLNVPNLEAVLATVPNARIPRTLDAVLEAYTQRKQLSALYTFADKYPDYANPSRLQLEIRKLKQQVQRGKDIPTDILLERLANARNPEFWPSADWALYERWPTMRTAIRDSVAAALQTIPFERASNTLRRWYASGTPADFVTLFPKITPQQTARLTPAYTTACKEAYAALRTNIKPALSRQDWKSALATAKTAQYAKPLEHYPPYQDLLDILSRPEEDEKMQLFGGALNTPQNEFIPVLSPDEKEMYFCRETSPTAPELLCKAVLENGEWKDLGEVPAFSTGSKNTAPLSLTVDGNRLLVFRDGMLTYADRQPDGDWGKTRPYSDNINAAGWQGMGTLSPDGQVIIFESRQRPTSIGRTDLFISFQDERGQWQPAIALNRVLNTPGEDRAPFLHPDTRTLYFSSDGRGGFGDMDVYKTTRLDDSWLHWSEPVHLGRFANTPGIDWCYKISTSGTYAYFSADPAGKGMADIYKINLPQSARPEVVKIVETQLVNSEGEAISGEVVIEDAETGEIMTIARPNATTGAIKVALPGNRDYILYTLPEDNETLPLNLNLFLSDDDSKLPEKVVLETVEEAIANGSVFRLNNIFFDYNDASLLPESEGQLQRVLAFFSKGDNFRMEIIGHTDSDGDDTYNMELSLRRANAVRQALIERNIAPDRLITLGKGETEPVTSNDSPRGKSRNRRVELRFVKG